MEWLRDLSEIRTNSLSQCRIQFDDVINDVQVNPDDKCGFVSFIIPIIDSTLACRIAGKHKSLHFCVNCVSNAR